MSELADLAKIFGIPVVAASIAGSIYWALSKAEEVARPEALAEVSAVLKDPSWSRSAKPWSIVERLFVWTFGERHFSVKCVTRSAISTVIMLTSLITLRAIITGGSDLLPRDIDRILAGVLRILVPFVVCVSIISDYIALLKTRVLLRTNHESLSIIILCLDVVGSMAISYISFLSLSQFVMAGHWRMTWGITFSSWPSTEFRILTGIDNNWFSRWYSAIYFSTLFTSIWLTLIVISTTLLKLLAPLHRFTAWFFDVEKHPLKAVGIVTGALVMLGAAIGTIVQKL